MAPSLVYEQRPSSPQRVYNYLGGESSSSNYAPYPSYGPSRPPPPPPQPPRSEGWDFLNLFDYAAPYALTQDSREVREEEGIPDLEDDDFHREVVKEVVHGKQKLVAPVSVDDKEEPPGGGGGGQASLFQTRPSVSVEKEEEVHVVEKKVVESGGEEVRRSSAAPRGGGGVRRGVPEVAKEIEAQFLRAAESASEIAVMLEVGKHPHARKHGPYLSSVLCVAF